MRDRVQERVRVWIVRNPGWFALQDDADFVVILATEAALPRLLEMGFPSPATSDEERAIVVAIRELCKVDGTSAGCLALSQHINIYYGARDALVTLASGSAGLREP